MILLLLVGAALHEEIVQLKSILLGMNGTTHASPRW
jgi:hypothetical protein